MSIQHEVRRILLSNVRRINSPIRTLVPSLALSLHEERTDLRSIPLIIRVCSCELLQHLLPSRLRLPHIKQRLVPLKLRVHVLRVVLPIDVATRRVELQRQRRISYLRRQPEFEVEEACLADILDLGTSLADNGGFEAHASAGVPAEDSEGAGAGTARTTIFLFGLWI